jgi:hypothetical protein
MAISNFPTPPNKGKISPDCFPSDLIQNNRDFHTDIALMDYSVSQQFGSAPALSMAGGIKLPMPRRINDVSVHNWNEISATQTALGAAQNVGSMVSPGATAMAAGMASTAYTAGSIYKGLALNPWMFMMYQRPGYKEHDLNWLLTAANKQESDQLNKIINQLKKAALPSSTGGGIVGKSVWKYPKIAMVSFKPDKYLFKFQPCAIISVAIDHTAGGTPSFFKSGAPTVVGLSLKLKEIALWTQDNYQGGQ